MRDARLDILRETFSQLDREAVLESRTTLRENKVYLPEAKKRFPHLTESFLLENKALMENINFFKVTVKEIQKAYPGLKFAEARALQKEFIQFSILDHHARNTPDEKFVESVNKSSKVILELEPFTGEDTIDPNSPEAKKWAQMMAATKGKGVDDTIGPKVDTSSGKEAPAPEKKKGFLGRLGDKAKAIAGLKTFIKKAANFIAEVAKSKETHKALAIGAALVIISVLPGAPILLPVAKGLLGLYSIYKGSKTTLDQAKKLVGDKTGVAGIKEYFKNISNVKEGAKLVGQIAQIGLGAWGASSAIGDVLTQVKTAAAEQMYNPDGAPAPTQSVKPEVAPQQQAPAEAPAPAAPVAPDVSKYSAWGMNKAEQIQSAIQDAAMGNGSLKEILDPLASKIGSAVVNGDLTREQGIAALEGLAKGVAQNNGGLPYKAIIGKLLGIAKLN